MYIGGAVDDYDRATSTYIVAYLDVLGVASRMETDRDGQKLPLNILHNLYTHSFKSIDDFELTEGIKYKIFSDNVIIAKEISKEPEQRSADIKKLLNLVSHFQCYAVGDGVGWLVRGGITIGELFINETMVWGTALLNAYKLENHIAIYPRVVIDNSLANEIRANEDIAQYVLSDFDNIDFLNYMSIWNFAGRMVVSGFEKIKKEALGRYGKYAPRIYQKLCWHMNYINSQLDLKNEPKDTRYRLHI